MQRFKADPMTHFIFCLIAGLWLSTSQGNCAGGSKTQSSDTQPEVDSSDSVAFFDSFDYPDGIITNEYAYWNPTHADAHASPIWEMTSGSIFSADGSGWSGVPDDLAPNADSSNGTHSAVYRLTTQAASFDNVSVEFDLLNEALSTTASTPAEDWDGVHIFLRYQSESNLYAVSINRRDNACVIKKKVEGGTENGGTYYTLSDDVNCPVPYGTWQKVKATIETDADNAVIINLYADDELIMSTVDNGALGGLPITAPGKVGIRGDNCNFYLDNFTVTRL